MAAILMPDVFLDIRLVGRRQLYARRLGIETQWDIDQFRLFVGFIHHTQFVVSGWSVEHDISLNGVSRSYFPQIAHPLRHSIPVAQLLVSFTLIVLDHHIRYGGNASAAVHRSNANQEEAVLWDARSRILLDLCEPLRLVSGVDQVSHLNFVTQRVDATRLLGFTSTSAEEERGNHSR